MRTYDKDNISEIVISDLKPLMADPLFTPEAMMSKVPRISGIAVCAAICGWARAMYVYNGVAKKVAPLKLEHAEAEARAAEARASGDFLQTALNGSQCSLGSA